MSDLIQQKETYKRKFKGYFNIFLKEMGVIHESDFSKHSIIFFYLVE